MGAILVQRSRIFISYRREDAPQAAGRLAEHLRAHFGRDQVFEDIASIAPGADFMDALRDGLATCAAVIVLMGPNWVTLTDRQGRRRIDFSDDWVRQEVAYGLQQQDVRVFPVLVDDAEMPRAEELPEDLRPLTRRQATPVTVRHWAKDVSLLAEYLKRVPGLHEAPVTPASSAAPATSASPFALGNKDCDVGPEMVVIPAGSFMMGSPASEQGRDSNEGPQHTVNIPVPFAVGKFQVTFDEWAACVRERGCDHNPGDQGWGRGKRPVINVSWNDAQHYLRWLSTKTGKTYRLLSEAEWEYVARAGTTTAFNTGTNINPTQANYDGSPKQTATVGSYPANAFGLYDVHGNVFEWTEDCWHDNYAGAPTDGSAWTTGGCKIRVIRGGGWGNYPQNVRSAYRFWCSHDSRINYLGFRVARTL